LKKSCVNEAQELVRRRINVERGVHGAGDPSLDSFKKKYGIIVAIQD
jgi:hypothetical protein